MKLVATKSFPGFEYSPDNLIRDIEACGIFTILLKGGEIVHFKPDNPTDFRKWLVELGLTDIRKEVNN